MTKVKIGNKGFIILLLFALIGYKLSVMQAQQMPVYSQYMLNGFLLNPAVAGHEGYTSLNLTAREQWLGLPDAPKTYALSAQTRLLRNSFISRSLNIRKRGRSMSRSGRVGLGTYIFNDKRGIYNNMGFQFTYAYHLSFRRSQLSFGLSGLLYQFRVSTEDINDPESVDISVFAKPQSLIPDANIGVYYTSRDIYAGVSMLQLFQNQVQFNTNEEIDYRVYRQMYLMGGYRFDLIDFVFIEPSALFKTNFKAGSQLDLNLKFYFREDYWAGISYRNGGALDLEPVFQEEFGGLVSRGGAIILMAGLRVDKYFFGYAFDYNMSSIARYSIGSHELMIAAKFGDNARRYRWLNRY
ncbi:MAG: type IX secretion system membrane protein PorP/SprF [Bacteroidetes bacterium]|nr:type IX secretion system membrane protein PorP/SprF [Bacteroidota bacterium]